MSSVCLLFGLSTLKFSNILRFALNISQQKHRANSAVFQATNWNASHATTLLWLQAALRMLKKACRTTTSRPGVKTKTENICSIKYVFLWSVACRSESHAARMERKNLAIDIATFLVVFLLRLCVTSQWVKRFMWCSAAITVRRLEDFPPSGRFFSFRKFRLEIEQVHK